MTSSFSLDEPARAPGARPLGPPGASGSCKRPGCGNPLPPPGGRGRARQFCSPECARRFHNAARRVRGNGRPVGEAAGARDQIEALTAVIAATRAELAAVRDEIAALRAELARRGPPVK